MTRYTLLFLFSVSCVPHTSAQPSSHYLFSYFTGNGEDGLHLAHSTDGYHWKPLNEGKSVLTPAAGKDKLMRDPSIIAGKDGRFHMVWTVSWGEKGIGYASSRDLINWSPQRYLPVMEHQPGTINCWAPELFYDEATKNYLLCGLQQCLVFLKKVRNRSTITASTMLRRAASIHLATASSCTITASA